MGAVLVVFALLALVGGIGTLLAAESAVHEIEAYVLFLTFSVLLAGAMIVDTLKSILKVLKEQQKTA